MTARDDQPVWYASYGSNCDADRFHRYLTGGPVPNSTSVEVGARNPELPRAVAPVRFAHQIRFTGSSSNWGGAPAFLEHRIASATNGANGVRYLITWGQLDDIVAQESRRATVALPIDDLGQAGARLTIGPGAYDGLLALEPDDGIPVVTFTAPEPPETRAPAPPSAAYLTTIVRGLASVHGQPIGQLVQRLLAAPGVAPRWTEPAILALLETPPTSCGS